MILSLNNIMYIEDQYNMVVCSNGIFKIKSPASIITTNKTTTLLVRLNKLLNRDKIELKKLNTFTSLLNNMIYNSQFGLVDYLYLKGVGFRVLNSYNILFFKLNYSHYIYYVLPLEMKVTVKKKNKLLKFNFFQERISGNVLNKLHKFRITNIYTQKGIFKRKQEVYKKEGKKKQL